jgi:type IV secretory pathway VirB3-like protein
MEEQANCLYFKEEQRFAPWVLILLFLVFVVIMVGRAPIFALFIVGGVALLIIGMKLVTEVDSDRLRVRFFPFVRRDIPLKDIIHWEARTYSPILEYGGWGIRTGLFRRRGGGALNARGNRGVQLRFADGKDLLVGSQRPEELAAAITLAKSERR